MRDTHDSSNRPVRKTTALEQVPERSEHLGSSLPNESEVENFAEFFLRGSDNLKKFAEEFDDIGQRFRSNKSPSDKTDTFAREDELAEILSKKTTTAIGHNSVNRIGNGISQANS